MARLDEQIQALINYANETTGKSDTHLGDAIKSLSDGYGQGGGSDDAFKAFIEGTATEFTVPDGVTTIRTNAFSDISTLERITLPNTVKAINSLAFYGCTNLREMNLGEGVETIGATANNSPKLLSLTIPASIKTISGGAFSASGITVAIMQGTVPPYIGSSPFPESAKIYVPDSVVDVYKTRNGWKNVASNIFPMSELQQD